MEPDPASLPRRREAVRWMGISLAVKIAALVMFARGPVWPVFDEAGYVATGLAARDALEQVIAGSLPSREQVAGFYGEGRRPPLFPALLGLAFWITGDLVGGRMVSVLAAAATTGMVYLWAGRMLGRRVGHLAAAFHLASFELLALSHLFWSECVFLLLIVVAFDRGWVAARGGRRRDAVAAGLALGLAAATRAAALPLLLVGPLLLLRGPRGVSMAAWGGATAALVLAPWCIWLRIEEGRWVPLSTTGGYNLLLGQVPDSRDRDVRRELVAAVRARAEATGESFDSAAAATAYERMSSAPTTSLILAAKRAGRVLAPTGHGVRHVVRVAYPPMPTSLAVILAWWSAAMAITVWLGAFSALVFGRLDRAVRGSFVVLGAALLVPLLPTVASARLGLPIFVLALPVAAAGWLCAGRAARWWLGGAVVVLTVLWSVAPKTDPCSSRYASAARWIGCTASLDRVVVRAAQSCPAPTVEAAAGGRVTATESRPGANGGQQLVVDIASDPPTQAKLRISCQSDPAAEIALIDSSVWREFRHTSIRGVELLWLGGNLSPSPFDRSWPAMPPVSGLPGNSAADARPSRAPRSRGGPG